MYSLKSVFNENKWFSIVVGMLLCLCFLFNSKHKTWPKFTGIVLVLLVFDNEWNYSEDIKSDNNVFLEGPQCVWQIECQARLQLLKHFSQNLKRKKKIHHLITKNGFVPFCPVDTEICQGISKNVYRNTHLWNNSIKTYFLCKTFWRFSQFGYTTYCSTRC